jgi:hypothetical protein
MSQVVEISLRIPSLRIAGEDADAPRVINNAQVRFCKQVEVESIPKPGVVLTMPGGLGAAFDYEVVRADWHHEKNMFVIACRYAKRSVSAAAYHAFMIAPDWHVRSLI